MEIINKAIKHSLVDFAGGSKLMLIGIFHMKSITMYMIMTEPKK